MRNNRVLLSLEAPCEYLNGEVRVVVEMSRVGCDLHMVVGIMTNGLRVREAQSFVKFSI